MKKDVITLKVPAKPEYVMVTRLTSAAVANRIGFDVDQIEDIKMSVAEAIILLINQPVRPNEILIDFSVEIDGIYIEINGEGLWEDGDKSTNYNEQTQLSRFILSSMMDKVEFKTDNGQMHAICMYKGCGGLID